MPQVRLNTELHVLEGSALWQRHSQTGGARRRDPPILGKAPAIVKPRRNPLSRVARLTAWTCMEAGVKALRTATASCPQSSGGHREQQQRRAKVNSRSEQQLRWIPAFAGMTARANGNGVRQQQQRFAGDVTYTNGAKCRFGCGCTTDGCHCRLSHNEPVFDGRARWWYSALEPPWSMQGAHLFAQHLSFPL
jgi:hypothetical protein